MLQLPPSRSVPAVVARISWGVGDPKVPWRDLEVSKISCEPPSQEGQALESWEKAWRKEDFPLVKEDQGRNHLSKLDIHKSMGSDGTHPRTLRELAERSLLRLLSIILKRSLVSRKGA